MISIFLWSELCIRLVFYPVSEDGLLSLELATFVGVVGDVALVVLREMVQQECDQCDTNNDWHRIDGSYRHAERSFRWISGCERGHCSQMG